MSTKKFFNTAGPNILEDHYTLPPLTRWDIEEILTLIDNKRYFVLHAPTPNWKDNLHAFFNEIPE
jgi:hypothetical protein